MSIFRFQRREKIEKVHSITFQRLNFNVIMLNYIRENMAAL